MSRPYQGDHSPQILAHGFFLRPFAAPIGSSKPALIISEGFHAALSPIRRRHMERIGIVIHAMNPDNHDFRVTCCIPDREAKLGAIIADETVILRIELWHNLGLRDQGFQSGWRHTSCQHPEQARNQDNKDCTRFRNSGKSSVSNQGLRFSHALFLQLGCGVTTTPWSKKFRHF